MPDRATVEKAKRLADEIDADRVERPGAWQLGDEVLLEMLKAAYPTQAAQGN